MKKTFILSLFFVVPFLGKAQTVSTSDFTNFITMRDSIIACSDSTKLLSIVRRLYIDKASEGLQAFMRNKENLDSKWLKLIQTQPSFWDSVAHRSVFVLHAADQLEKEIKRLRIVYPSLKPARTFFLVGIRQQGGTTRGNASLIGTEVVLSSGGLTERKLVRMAVHEYIHTQQSRPDFQKIDVLTSSIREGACDFIASLITGIAVDELYTRYGKKHEQEVWLSFQKDMYTTNNDNWVSTGNNPALPAPDLGYFVGYRICEKYYKKANDKIRAVADIIELDYSNKQSVSDFLAASGYTGK